VEAALKKFDIPTEEYFRARVAARTTRGRENFISLERALAPPIRARRFFCSV
jgi:hypothetical protein